MTLCNVNSSRSNSACSNNSTAIYYAVRFFSYCIFYFFGAKNSTVKDA